jgi:hypothetical protein
VQKRKIMGHRMRLAPVCHSVDNRFDEAVAQLAGLGWDARAIDGRQAERAQVVPQGPGSNTR